MTRRKTIEEAREIVEKYKFAFIESYVNNEETRVIMKDNIGYRYDVSLKDFSNKEKKTVKFVHVGNPFSLENIKLWILINNKKFSLLEENEYKGSSEKLFFNCLSEKCLEVFDSTWNDIHSGKGCPYCSSKRVGKRNSLAFLYPELLSEWSYSKNTILPSKITSNSHRRVYWSCSTCGNEWITSPSKRVSDKTGCPLCQKSKGELRIHYFLKRNKISFENQKEFLNCRHIQNLQFDFYLSDYNLCVEYDGVLHYEDKFNNPKEFKLTKKRDRIKTKYCKDNNINLLRIPYWEFDNIENILEKTLSELR